MELRLYIKQTVQVDKLGQQVYYEGTNPYNLHLKYGQLPLLRQWINYGSYINVTDQVSDIHKLSLTWTSDRDVNGVVVPGALQSKKSASGTLTFEGKAYQLLKQWLFDDVSASLNKVDVKIEHVGCDYYEGYQIHASDIRFCENDICVFSITLKQKDEPLNCIKRTMIADNWQGWFNNTIDPADPQAKKHPRFSYCNEVRPNGMMILQWYIAIMTMTVTGLMMITLIPIINPILALLQLIQNALNSIPGVNVSWNIPNPINIADLLEAFQKYFIESAGCGREHPAPLIRDYIQNVCSKCGIGVDDITAPIFFSTTMKSPTGHFITASGKDIYGWHNYYYNACYFYSPVERGVRRFKSLSLLNKDPDDTTFWLPANEPLLTGDMLLDQLKGMFNFEWRVQTVNGKPYLYIWRKDWYLYGQHYLYDFTATHPDRLKILSGLCFEWNSKKNPAFVKGLYTLDTTDSAGREAQKFQDGYYPFGNVDENPTFDGILDKTQQFGAAKFRLDGASTDYVYDALQVISNSAAFTFPFINGAIRDFIYPAFDKYADYALLLSDETATLPKILLWNSESYTNAKAINYWSGWQGNNNWGLNEPTPNNNYPSQTTSGNFIVIPWSLKHFPQTFVIGSSLSFGSYPVGTYKVNDYFGINLASKPALLINYPMYFAPEFEGGMWDNWHWIDDPKRNPKLNQDWGVKIALCCEDLQKLKVFKDSVDVQLGGKVKLPLQYIQDGLIKEITVSYDTDDTIGSYIEIKGEV